MAKLSLKVVGAAELAKRLKAKGDKAAEILPVALKAGATIIQNAAKQNAPKRTSTLRRSIVVEVKEDGGGRFTAHIGPTVQYGAYVEYGTGIYAEGGNGRNTPWVYKAGNGRFYTTSGMPAKPFMRPAFDDNREAAVNAFRRVAAKLATEVT